MIDNFTNILLDLPIEKEFDRIKKNNEISSANIPYTIQYLNMLLKHFEYYEEYEKCQILLKYINSKIDSHDAKYI